MAIEIHQFPCLQDNYGFLVRDTATGMTATIDTPDAQEILAQAAAKGWRITHILNTHHHADHAGGNLDVKAATGARIIGPRAEAKRIAGLEEAVGEGDEVRLGQSLARVFDVPGHTSGHIAYWFEGDGVAFVGDTLFAGGCGRLFEGTAQEMCASLSKLKSLPADTRVYCAHEYTESNLRFALSVEPGNAALQARAQEVGRLRQAGLPTVPTTIGLEQRTNPFLRWDSDEIQAAVGKIGMPPSEVFAETRRRKDVFR